MKRRKAESPLSEKISQILKGILLVLCLFGVKLWYLAIVCHEQKCEQAAGPQRKTIIEKAERACICDRFDTPLAINRIHYQAGVCYAPITKIPRVSWKISSDHKEKIFERKEYIKKLSQKLAEELFLDAERVEDLIYAKAAALGGTPLILKEDISEECYFKLCMLEKDWPGLYTKQTAKRHYPLGKVAAEIIGYIGPISQEEYKAALEEIKLLKERQELEGIDLTQEIEKKSLAFNDLKGKMGAEALFDEQLRGSPGKKVYYVDRRGGFVRKLYSSEEPKSGQRVNLSIAAELQVFAEQLLANYNTEASSSRPVQIKRKQLLPEHQPWIKEGAVVVMDPHNGELLALASYPRFDLQDFIKVEDAEVEKKRQRKVAAWMENESYLGAIWDQKYPLIREKFDSQKKEFYDEKIYLGWEEFLSFILPQKSPIFQTIEQKGRIADAFAIQRQIDTLQALFAGRNVTLTLAQIFDFLYEKRDLPSAVFVTLTQKKWMRRQYALYKEEIDKTLQNLEPYFAKIPLNEEKLILVDLYRLAVNPSTFTPLIEELFKEQSLAEFRDISAKMTHISDVVRDIVQSLFRDHEFKQWREKHFKRFLKEKRREEKIKGMRYAKPYTEYLDQKERELFKNFWQSNKLDLITQFLAPLSKEQNPYMSCLNNWRQELQAGAHKAVAWKEDYEAISRLCNELELSLLQPYFRTLRSFEDLKRPLYGFYPGLRKEGGCYLEKNLAEGFYPKYGYGYLRSHAFRQATTIGSLFKLVPAYEAMKQKFLKNGEGRDLNPLTIIDDKHYYQDRGWIVGKTLEGKTIPMHYRGGRLPRTDHAGVGRVDIIAALAASSNPYFALLAGDVCEDPEDLCLAASLFGFGQKTGIDLAGEYQGQLPDDITYNRTGLYSMAIGQHTLLATPLQAATMLSSIVNGGKMLRPQIVKGADADIRWQIFMPKELASMLIQGMRAVVMGEKGTARFARAQFPPSLINRVIGKTSTAEVIKRYGVDSTSRSLKGKEIWFGSVVYDEKNNPELVIIVYLKEGEYGSMAVPLALKLAEKWHAIRLNHQRACNEGEML